MADAFHDRNMQLIIKMLTNVSNTSKQAEVDEYNYCRSYGSQQELASDGSRWWNEDFC